MSDTLYAENPTETPAYPSTDFNLPDVPPEGQYDGGDDDDSDNDDDATETESAKGASRSARPAKTNNRALIRRTATKAVEVVSATDTERALAASLVGSGTDPVDLTTAIMNAPRGVQGPLAEIDSIAEAFDEDPVEAGISAASLEPARLKAVWSLLHVIDVVPTPAPPAVTSKAASGVVRGISKMTDETKRQLANVAELLKRS